MNHVIIQRELESINLKAKNRTYVTKGEIESNFLVTLTNESKLNHWVNQIVINLGRPVCIFKKLLSILPFFSFKKRDLNLVFLIKHHIEEIREGNIKNLN